MKLTLKTKCLAGLFLTGVFFNLSYADTIYLKNGHSVEGIVRSEEGETVELEVGISSSVTFLKNEIEKIIKSSAADVSFLRRKWEKDKVELKEKIAKLQVEDKNKPSAISFSNDPQGLVVSVKLNDKVNAKMVLDTGSSLVMITKNVALKLGINLSSVVKPDMKAQVADGRQVNARRVILETMEVQGVVAKNVEAAVLLDDAGGFGFGDGLLGMSFLNRFNFKVDQKAKKLILERP